MIIYKQYAIILPNIEFSCPKGGSPTIPPLHTSWILVVCLTTQMKVSIQLAQLSRSLYFIGITTAHSWALEGNIHQWATLHLIERVDILSLGSGCYWNWTSWLSGVQQNRVPENRNLALQGVIEVILFTFRIFDPVMQFRNDPLVGIGIFYLPMEFHMVNRSRDVKWLMVVPQHILKFDKYTIQEYILIISKHPSTDFVSAVGFSVCTESLSKWRNSKIYWCISEW